MSNVVHKEDHENYTINVVHYPYALDPREESDGWIGTMICSHNRYNFPNESNFTEFDEYESWDEIEELLRNTYDIAVILPIYLYDHSGITIRTTPFSCRWDSGRLGLIYTTKSRARESFPSWKSITSKREEELKRMLNEEVKIYDQFIRGETYGFEIKDEDGEIVESCYGFYGDPKSVVQEAKAYI